MKGHGLVLFIDHWQTNPARLGLVNQLAVFFPAVQGGQGVKLTFDGPIGTNDGIGPPHQPNTHNLLQHVGAL